ncbi:MAG: 5-methyltetrahydropteroyltriglutamate--homocysteine S-methyltransferase [Sporolactobacillus sp.]
MTNVRSTNIGYPRIGAKREWKKALEQFWNHKIEKDEFLETIRQLRLSYLRRQQALGIDLIPVGDFSLYDHVLDTAVAFGLIPDRFQHDGGPVSLDTYYAIARGNRAAEASEMTKWFDTNYHYIVPEISNDTAPYLTNNRWLDLFNEAKQALGITAKPVILGPITLLRLAKGFDDDHFTALLGALLPLYAQVIGELKAAGADWIQLDEPILVKSSENEDLAAAKNAYRQLKTAVPGARLLLQTYFEAVDNYPSLIQLPVDGIGLDFIADGGSNLAALEHYGFPADKTLFAGLIDGRNVWRSRLGKKLQLAEKLLGVVGSADKLVLGPSSSLLHVPVTVKNETALDPLLRGALAFADEKLGELTTLVTGINAGHKAVAEAVRSAEEAVDALQQSASRNNPDVESEAAELGSEWPARPQPFAVRQQLQDHAFGLPLLPTTTIGSFPQTAEVRSARRKWRKGEWDDARYDAFIQDETKRWIDIQEEIGLDVLVHGEFERNDMVEYFGEQLGGFAFTSGGWVQSYGSRGVKPPLIYGDVVWNGPITVHESAYAQSLTKRPVKGMLTGPVTIYNWSFARNDISQREVFNQIALALKKEIHALEQAGIHMIQVDEPALREGLPLKDEKKADYLNRAVYAFRLATTVVEATTQIHTHMCYSEFDEIIEAIDALDTDVISIEAARSHGEIIETFETFKYTKGIGLGVYDIHSPRIPSIEEMQSYAERALKVLDPHLFWINPDCGLKTRKPEEAIPALKHMVEAAKRVRAGLANHVGR